MAIMEFGVHQFPNIKLGVHIAQAVIMAVAWCLCIAVFKSSAIHLGRVGWYFGLVFLTIPALIYLTMTPRFPRTRRFANPYALVAVDLFYCIAWLSAFAAVASWNGTGQCKGGCTLSKVIVALGVFLWLLFAGTTFMSIYACMYYRREGYLPGGSRAPNNAAMIDPDKEAFSTAPHDEYAPVHDTDDHEIHDAPEYSGAKPSTLGGEYDDAPAYGSYAPPHVEDENTAYTGYSGRQSPGIGPTGRLQFPDARYDNV
ncbi:hypothetical protein D0Z07_5526 [Hyphodiscus hymeniophilus]|uniref:MARVEL domain-containing protein n=1 Tax=Hyphodiscus hymeniophilus TaxID=353542 RepID=A0A9P6VI19_9HELO|nr:hypothetical protein D0Z07_5526 [Hyphodiscus hymeniophilus]